MASAREFFEFNQLKEEVTAKFNEFYKRKVSRFDVEWGCFSAEKNKFIRSKMESFDFEDTSDKKLYYRYQCLFQLWINYSKLLELHHKHPTWMARIKRKKLDKVVDYLLREIKSDNPAPRRLSKEELIRMALDGTKPSGK